MAERDRDDSMEVHCGRCGTLLIVRLEDIKEKHTIDCEACERTRPAENELPVTRSSRVSASAHVGSGDGMESLATHALLDDAGNPLSARLQHSRWPGESLVEGLEAHSNRQVACSTSHPLSHTIDRTPSTRRPLGHRPLIWPRGGS